MNQDQFEREKRYGAAMSIAKALLARGMVNEAEYHKIDAMFAGKYRPVIGRLRAGIS